MRFLLPIILIAFLLTAYAYVSYSHLSPRVRAKERRLAKALVQAGHKPAYWLISGYRPPWLNRLMLLSAPTSDHQRGLAIDLWVGDVDRDGHWTEADMRLVANAIDRMDEQDPVNRGGLGRYSSVAWRMVHFDVSGKRRRWGR